MGWKCCMFRDFSHMFCEIFFFDEKNSLFNSKNTFEHCVGLDWDQVASKLLVTQAQKDTPSEAYHLFLIVAFRTVTFAFEFS
jgi:hypothetical protein